MSSRIEVIRDNIIYRVLNWNYKWIREQKASKNQKDPPILGATLRTSSSGSWNIPELPLTPVTLSFDNLVSYESVFHALILSELWANLRTEVDSAEFPEFSLNFRIRVEPINQDGFTILKLPPNEGTLQNMDLVSLTLHQHDRQLEDKTVFGVVKWSDIEEKNSLCVWVKACRVPKLPFSCTVGKIFPFNVYLKQMALISNLDWSPLFQSILHPIQIINKNTFTLDTVNVELNTTRLNSSQYEAVESIASTFLRSDVNEPKVALLQGPPGTGKTRVIIELIQRLIDGRTRRNETEEHGNFSRILVCAPSNNAVDEITTRLRMENETRRKQIQILRIGRVDNIHPTNLEVTAIGIMKKSKKETLLKMLSDKKEAIQNRKTRLFSEIRKSTKDSKSRQAKEQAQLLKEIELQLDAANQSYEDCLNTPAENMEVEEGEVNEREKELARGSQVILSTLNYCRKLEILLNCNMTSTKFLCCVIDEASQCTEPESIAPISLGITKLVFIGDPKQLPASVNSQSALKNGFDQSYFNRLYKVRGRSVMMLTTQYRMASTICQWPSQHFYGGLLKTAANLLRDGPCYNYRLLDLIDGVEDHQDKSIKNAFEADLVVKVLTVIFATPLSAGKKVGIITFYKSQKELIINKINEGNLQASHIEVNTVDSFQGREKDVIIVSCVRARDDNSIEKIGFLSSLQRLNVAITRAKETLIVCGRLDTLQKNPTWKSLVSDARIRGLLKVVTSDENQERLRSLLVRPE